MTDFAPGAAARLLLAALRAYRLLLSPWLGGACRFEPSCSRYASAAIERHGAAAGGYLAARRLLRCHPGCRGGCDPVPEQAPRLWVAARREFSSSVASRKTLP